jgi:hypothetical protein
VSLELWSPTTDSVAGRVLHWAAGDVILPAEQFGPIVGRYQRNGQIHLEVSMRPPASSITIDGTLATDTLTIEHASQGQESWPVGQPVGGHFVRRH